MGRYASKVVEHALSMVGIKEKTEEHKELVDRYNAHKPLARGYKVKYTDNWCALFGSLVGIDLGYTDIIPTECSCQKMIELFKAKGIWCENENRVPNVGDYCFYDWDDGENYTKTDNTGWSDHVGIVVEVFRNTFKVVEGNYSNSVKVRTLKVNDRFIRGFGVPKYDAEPMKESEVVYTMKNLKKGSTGIDVTIFETIMTKLGYYDGEIDDSFGNKCVAACNRFQEDYRECGTNNKPDSNWGKKCWTKVSSMLKA